MWQTIKDFWNKIKGWVIKGFLLLVLMAAVVTGGWFLIKLIVNKIGGVVSPPDISSTLSTIITNPNVVQDTQDATKIKDAITSILKS